MAQSRLLRRFSWGGGGGGGLDEGDDHTPEGKGLERNARAAGIERSNATLIGPKLIDGEGTGADADIG